MQETTLTKIYHGITIYNKQRKASKRSICPRDDEAPDIADGATSTRSRSNADEVHSSTLGISTHCCVIVCEGAVYPRGNAPPIGFR